MVANRSYFNRRVSQLKNERRSFIGHYKELSTNISPVRGRFEITDRNKGVRRHNSIINSKGTQALGTAQAGMFSGVMSPARPWFNLINPNPDLMKFQPVKAWYDDVTRRMRSIFNSSNLYVMAPTVIREVLLFATGCMTHVDDKDNLARFFTHTAGSYMVSQNDRFEVDTFAKEMEMTAEQMARAFTDGKDLSRLSTPVRNALDRNNFHAWFPVVHFIEPNDAYRPTSFLSKHKKFSSVKFEPGNIDDKNVFLSEGGFDEFPVYVPRWGLTGEDVYGTDCPGMVTLGDVKQLQIQEKRKAQAIDKMVNPPLTGPPSVRNKAVSSLPGGLTIYDGDPTRNKLERLYEVNLPLQDLKLDMDRVEARIDNAFFVDLFLAISNMQGIQPRNQLELSERNAERLLQLGPVLERLQGEFLDPMIKRTFNQMIRAELIPPAPTEIQGSELKIDYVSSLAQAQRSVDTKSIDRLTQFEASLISAGLSDGKKYDGDKALERYAELIGTPPDLIVDDTVVAKERQAEQQIQQRQAALDATTQAAQAAQMAGQVDLNANNPVSAAVNNINASQGNPTGGR